MVAASPPSKNRVPAIWRKLWREIPGYDPESDAEGCYFDAEAAQTACDFFPECLQFIEGKRAGEPFALEPWQKAIVSALFGWKREDGTRRYREAMVYVPRKNGKTPFAAGILLLAMFTDGEPGAQLYSAAAERQQAALIYRHASEMIRREPELARRAKILKGSYAVEYEAEGTIYKALSADAETKHGLNVHLAAIDELHAHRKRDLADVLLTSTASRTQPLILYITTADFHRESICNEVYDRACKVRDGIITDESFLPVIFEALPDDDWTDEKVWEKANPNIDVSVSREYLRRQCKKAQDQPTYENTFKRLHLNIRTQQDVRWLQLEAWDKCGGDVDPEALRGLPCYAGLDLSSTFDVTALSLLFPHDDGTYTVLPFFWIPAANAHQRERRDRVPYQTWAREGLIETTDGNVVDYGFIRKRLNELREVYDIREIAIDRWNSTQLQTELAGDDFNVVQFGQGYASMTDPTKELERLVISAKLHHGGNPVLRWMASNVAVEMNAAGDLKPSKARSTEKIDGIVATVMALGRAMVRDSDGGSVYDERGLSIL